MDYLESTWRRVCRALPLTSSPVVAEAVVVITDTQGASVHREEPRVLCFDTIPFIIRKCT